MLSKDEVNEITLLAKRQIACQDAVADLEEKLKVAKRELREVAEVDLPAALAQAGVSGLTLATGEKISIKNDIAVSIPVGNQGMAMDWLEVHEHGDVIKNTIAVNFAKGQEEIAKAFELLVKAQGFEDYKRTRGVHPQTLKALLRELLASGVDVPFDTFGIYPLSTAVIK